MEADRVQEPPGVQPGDQDLRGLLERHVRGLEERLGPGPSARCFYAPGRVNLMGAHLDYNGGPVMPMGIDRGTFIAVRPRNDRTVRVATAAAPGTHEWDLDAPEPARRGAWVDYPFGVLQGLRERTLDRQGLDVLFGGNLKVGAGLSSSASMCVGTAWALDRVWELGLEPMDRVHLALRAEREFVGVRCGIMDPYAVGLARPGHLLWLDCKDASTDFLPLDGRRVAVAVTDTGVRRRLAQGEFNRRVDECRSAYEKLHRDVPEATCLRDVPAEALEAARGELLPEEDLRARHVIDEVRRTFEARAALEAGDLAGFGRRMLEAHDSLRDLFQVSVPELDCLVEAARAQEGVLGSRLTGAGFGGCTVTLLRREARQAFAAKVGESFESRFGTRPSIEFFAGDPGPREIELG